MKKIFNGLFYVLKFLLLIAAFALTLFIMIRLNARLNKSVSTMLPTLAPFLLLLLLFVLNLIFRQEGVTKNVFYNLTCCLVFAVIIFCCYRAIFDKNMIISKRYGYGIDFNYFDNLASYINIMMYGLCIGDIFFMFKERTKKVTE